MNTEPKLRPTMRRPWLAAAAAALILLPMLTAATAPAQKMFVAVNDTLRGDTEDIAFVGRVIITQKIIDDATVQGPRILELVLDFSEVIGTGARTGKKYVTTAQTILHRPLVALDAVQASFPYYNDGSLGAARSALASLAVSYAPLSGLGITLRLMAPGL